MLFYTGKRPEPVIYRVVGQVTYWVDGLPTDPVDLLVQEGWNKNALGGGESLNGKPSHVRRFDFVQGPEKGERERRNTSGDEAQGEGQSGFLPSSEPGQGEVNKARETKLGCRASCRASFFLF